MIKKQTLLGLALAAGYCLSAPAWAHDLGVQGQLWPIQEVDLRELITEQVAKVNWDAINAQMVQSVKTFFDDLPQYGLPLAQTTKTVWVDPSIILNKPIVLPVKDADGNYAWRQEYPAGTKVNPLDYVTPISRMLFFSGNDPEQVAFVKAVLRAHPNNVMPVETDGNPTVLSKAIQRPVFYASTPLLTRFGIQKIPSLLGAGRGEYSHYLAVTQMAPPYSVETVDAAWYGLVPSKKESPQ